MAELLTIRRPTRAYYLVKSVPKPKNSVPKRGLPVWTAMGLEQKLPLVNAPKSTIVFTRDKIGNTLWKKSDSQDFVLYDPYCLDVSYSYEPLHDQHLKNYFSVKGNLKLLKELGLVTESGDAVCSLREFNEYRRYLRRLHLDSINKERMRRDALDKEKRDIEIAMKYAERDAEAAVKAEEKKLLMAGVLARMEREEKLKKEDVERRIQRRARQLEIVERVRKEQNEARTAKGKARDLRTKERMETAACISRRRTIITLRKWREADADLRMRQKRSCRERRKSKEEKDQRRWKERIEYQINRMNYTRELLENEAKDLANRVILRNMKVQKERDRMTDLFQRIKEQSERKRSLEQTRRQSQYIAKVLCENWISQIPGSNEIPNQKVVEETMAKALITFHSEKQNNGSIIDILEEAKVRLTEIVYLPPDVTAILDEILEKAIQCFLKNKVCQLVEDIISRGVQTIKNVSEKRNSVNSPNHINGTDTDRNECKRRSSASRRLSTPSGDHLKLKKNSRLSVPEIFFSQRKITDVKQKLNGENHGRSVSFGKVYDIGLTAQEITVEELKSVKDRPPTPVPSLTDIATAVFDTPISLDDIDEAKQLTRSSSGVNMYERDELISQLKYLTQEVSHRVYIHLQKELENRSERKRRSLVITQEEIVNNLVEGIHKQGIDYSSNISELEWITHGILGIVLHRIWIELYQVQDQRRHLPL